MQIELPRVGELVDGKYQLEETIGEGGFARVFRATDVTVGRSVALKVLKPGESGYAVTVASRFAREARALAGLTDAHTLRLFDFGRTDDGVLFMVSELLSGADLRTLLNERSLSEDEVVHILRQLLSALREAHEAGILHRDIKPSNVQVFEHLDDPLTVKLIDFGIARPTGPEVAKITQTGAVIGTPRYMSPEQAVGSPLTPSSDLFSVGLVALEMLTGDPRAPLDALLAGRSLEIQASPKLRAILERMLQQSPERRFANAGEVLTAFDAPVEQLDGSPRSGSYSAPRRTTSSSNASRPLSQVRTKERLASPRMLAVGGIAAMVVVFGLGLFSMSQRNQREVLAPGANTARSLGTVLLAPSNNRREPPATSRARSGPASAVDAPDLGGEVADLAVFADGCGREHSRGRQDDSHSEGGSHIEWTTWVPRRYDPDTRHPLVILIHGSDGEARDLLLDGGAVDVADRAGFIAVAPQASDSWSFEDEGPARFLAIVNRTAARFCVDPDRIFVLGHDTAGATAERLGCEPWVRGVASTSWRPRQQVMPCKEPKPRIIFSPTNSRHLPLQGGTQCVGQQVFSVQKFEAVWQERNECRGEPKRIRRKGAECWQWDCAAPLTSCHVHGGHNWQGMSPRRFDILGCDGAPAEFSYMGAAWDFFEHVEDP